VVRRWGGRHHLSSVYKTPELNIILEVVSDNFINQIICIKVTFTSLKQYCFLKSHISSLFFCLTLVI